MLPPSEETLYFESRKAELMAAHRGRFAVICGRRLLGVFDTVADAMSETADAFDRCNLPAGAPILITQIEETARVRVMARSSRSAAPEAALTT